MRAAKSAPVFWLLRGKKWSLNIIIKDNIQLGQKSAGEEGLSWENNEKRVKEQRWVNHKCYKGHVDCTNLGALDLCAYAK